MQTYSHSNDAALKITMGGIVVRAKEEVIVKSEFKIACKIHSVLA